MTPEDVEREVREYLEQNNFLHGDEERRKGLAALHLSAVMGMPVEEARSKITYAQWQYRERIDDSPWLVYHVWIDRPLTHITVDFKINDKAD